MAKFSSLLVPSALAALAIGVTPAAAAPAMARHSPPPASAHYAGFGQAINLQRDIAALDSRIDNALANRRISSREAKGLRRDARDLERLFAQSKRGGLTRFEARTIESRLAQFNGALRAERRDRDLRRG